MINTSHKERHKTETQSDEYEAPDDGEMEEFFAFLATEGCDEAKLQLISCQWRRYCRSPKAAKAAFCSINILKLLAEQKDRPTLDLHQLISFMCFAVMKSSEVRDCIVDELFYEGKIYTSLRLLSMEDTLSLVLSCSLDIVTDSEMRRILDFVLCLPQQYLVARLLVLKKLARSLRFVKRKHAIRLFYVMNSIAIQFLNGAFALNDHDLATFGKTVSSIAKKISRALGDYPSFALDIWGPLLENFKLAHDIVVVCRAPIVIEDVAVQEMPFKNKLALI